MYYFNSDPIDPSKFYNLIYTLIDDNEKYEVKYYADVTRDVGRNVCFEGVHPPHIIGGSTYLYIVQDGAELIFEHLSLRNWNNFEILINKIKQTSFTCGDLWSLITLRKFIAYSEKLDILDKLGFELEPHTHYKLQGEGYFGTWKLYF
jgi:hypothetical protein